MQAELVEEAFTLSLASVTTIDDIVTKVAAVFVCMAGVGMTTLGKTWAADDSQLNASLPLIDEIHSKGQIPEITLLSFTDLSIQVEAMDCISQIAYYFGRREVIEEMIKQGLIIDKLMELQRSSINTTDQNPDNDSPFSNWVSRFAVQVEIGEGLSSKEKMEIKLEKLKRVKEASVSETETATIVAEVLWGSSP
ncbi:hypothetical protein EZV62_013559 [Acer yangbiense]|uniref:Uncharacterized protein n=1 Tax=Acer yangbiense TaxID=1000413 RepID=A0A5C7I0E4_9ROSI|nr:hypothetical protein EZV62_013559 [Acer yangbiense]